MSFEDAWNLTSVQLVAAAEVRKLLLLIKIILMINEKKISHI